MLQDLPTHSVFGMIERGDDWNRPMRASMSCPEIGLIYLPFCISLCMILLYSSANSTKDSLFGQDCVLVIVGKLMMKLTWRP